MTVEINHTIKDPVGIHARPAATLVTETKKFEAKISIEHNGKTVDAKSIMGIMTLGAKSGETIKIVFDGADEAEAKANLENFLSENL